MQSSPLAEQGSGANENTAVSNVVCPKAGHGSAAAAARSPIAIWRRVGHDRIPDNCAFYGGGLTSTAQRSEREAYETAALHYGIRHTIEFIARMDYVRRDTGRRIADLAPERCRRYRFGSSRQRATTKIEGGSKWQVFVSPS